MEIATSIGTAITSGISTITSSLTTFVGAVVENEALRTFIGIGVAFSIASYVARFVPKLKH